MKVFIFTTLLAFASFAKAESIDLNIEEPTPSMQFLQWEESYQFELPYDSASKDSLIQLMSATTEEYYAMFVDGGECHSGTRLGDVIKQNDGVIRGTITVFMDGYCRLPTETEDITIERAKEYVKSNLEGVEGLVVNW
jgi:hypothetical protein